MTWWLPTSPDSRYEAILCDGAVRSGKTLAMGIGFFLWSMTCFRGQSFAVCGRSVGSVRRNLLESVLPWLRAMGMQVTEKASRNLLLVRFGPRENRFYLFGGKDEAAQGSIQGMTLAGVLLDEAVLMPRSFVEQACARCSVAGSRIWMNCNPEGPQHWLYLEWVCKAEQRGCLYLHYTMQDNPALTERIRRRYERLYSGVFYRRFVLGLWTQAEGRVYDFFGPEMVRPVPSGEFRRWVISCDYGTVNPASFGLWGWQDGVWYRVGEFYFDSRREGRQMTDAEYLQALLQLKGSRTLEAVVVDPSAASFLEVLRRQGLPVRKAVNEVLSGIRLTAQALKDGRIVLTDNCPDCLREMELYVWQERGSREQVLKKNDHAMDDMRYFVSTVLAERGAGFAVCTALRQN